MNAVWIPMRTDLAADPVVASIAERFCLPTACVVGLLYGLWCWATEHSDDGRIHVPHLSHFCPVASGTSCNVPVFMDTMLRAPDGFLAFLAEAEWLSIEGDCIVISDWDRWFSKSAKQRLLNTRRRRLARSGMKQRAFVNEPENNSVESGAKKHVPLPAGQTVMYADEGGGGDALLDPLRVPRENPEEPKIKPKTKSSSAGVRVRERALASGPHHELIRLWESIWAELHPEAGSWVWSVKDTTAIMRARQCAKGDTAQVELRMRRLLLQPSDAWQAQHASPTLVVSLWNELGAEITVIPKSFDELELERKHALLNGPRHDGADLGRPAALEPHEPHGAALGRRISDGASGQP